MAPWREMRAGLLNPSLAQIRAVLKDGKAGVHASHGIPEGIPELPLGMLCFRPWHTGMLAALCVSLWPFSIHKDSLSIPHLLNCLDDLIWHGTKEH